MLSEKEIISLLKPCLKKPFVLLETAVEDKENFTSFLFKDFTKVITFNYNDNLDFFFKQIEDCLKKKSWLCGFFSYEFGYFLEPALYHLRTKGKLPLAWLAATKNPQEIIPKAEKDFSCTKNNLQSLHIKNIRPNIDYNQYQAAIKKIKKYLANGTNYQTNFTFKIKFNFSGDILNFYLKLRKAQPTSYSALINTGDRFIVSLSPELFFRVNGNRITTRPMKGSLARGFTLTEDKIRQDLLKADKKIIAENLMIVDLLRNDLGRIAEKVWVPKLFTAEKYRTIHQMTSTIAAKLKENISLKSLFTALFPSGSVTGAPKIKTMQIINRLEKEPRGIYTGAIGYISPEKSACFNVAIRTAAIRDDKGEMGIGGGIVYDSNPRQEYEEALLKAKFLREQFYNFELIETILWQNQRGYFLLALHLNRLKKSCDYFSIKLDFEKLNKELTVLENKLKSTNANSKVRVLVGLEGGIKLESSALGKIEVPVKIKISPKRINPNDPFLYHKTTKRELYEEELAKAKKEGFFEVIFQNLHSEITEGSITNIFILKNSMFYTPPVKCGLLPGVLREHLFITGKAKEKLLYRADIFGADKVYIGNSVRGLCEAQI